MATPLSLLIDSPAPATHFPSDLPPSLVTIDSTLKRLQEVVQNPFILLNNKDHPFDLKISSLSFKQKVSLITRISSYLQKNSFLFLLHYKSNVYASELNKLSSFCHNLNVSLSEFSWAIWQKPKVQDPIAKKLLP